MRPNFPSILFYFFIKYFAFYLFLMVKDDNYSLLNVESITTGRDLIYYLFLILSLPIASIIIFLVPTYFVFKIRNRFFFTITVFTLFTLEYFLYTYFASQANYYNGLFSALISLILFVLLFHKSMPFSKLK